LRVAASFHTIIFAYGRQIYSLSRAVFSQLVLETHGVRRTPQRAMISGTAGAHGDVRHLVRIGAERGRSSAALLNIRVRRHVLYVMQGSHSFCCVPQANIDRRTAARVPAGQWRR
jgi:ethanolamine permease